MKSSHLPMLDIFLIGPKIYGDDNSFISNKSYQQSFETTAGYNVIFYKKNDHNSQKKVLRVSHCQISEVLGELEHMLKVEDLVAAIDLRNLSANAEKWISVPLHKEAKYLHHTTDCCSQVNERNFLSNNVDFRKSWPFQLRLEPTPLNISRSGLPLYNKEIFS